MIAASFNVNSIRARLPILLRWLEKTGPDVVCIQETKTQDENFPVSEIGSAGYNAVFWGQKSYNGVAILSRVKPERVHVGFEGDGSDPEARLIAAWIEGIPVVNTYVPQGFHPSSEKFLFKLNWFERLEKFFTKYFDAAMPLLWMGDFNVAPETIDVYDPERLLGNIGYHPDEHKALEKVKQLGFVDVYRKHCKDGGKYTFWDYRVRDAVKRGLGWRVDHIWATRKLAEKSARSWIDTDPRLWERPSDHTPICAEFSL